ncbi:MAG: alpha/beta fold hydrolase [Paracoccaceae bacterium]
MSRFVTSDGLSLDWDDSGTGVPVLCLAGLTRDKSDFDDFAAAIGGAARLIRLTSRGRKGSDFDPDPMHYTIPVEARDAIELLDHVGLRKAVIVGTSRGGLIAMLIAATAPQRLAGVLLNDIGPEIAPEGVERIRDFLGRNPVFRDYEQAADGLAELNAQTFPGVSRERWLACARRWWKSTPGGLRITYDPKLRDTFEAAGAQPAPDLWPMFDAMRGIPLALVRGANSDILSAETAAAMRARRPDMIFAELPDRGHVPFLDEPECVSAFRQLLEKVKP